MVFLDLSHLFHRTNYQHQFHIAIIVIKSTEKYINKSLHLPLIARAYCPSMCGSLWLTTALAQDHFVWIWKKKGREKTGSHQEEQACLEEECNLCWWRTNARFNQILSLEGIILEKHTKKKYLKVEAPATNSCSTEFINQMDCNVSTAEHILEKCKGHFTLRGLHNRT